MSTVVRLVQLFLMIASASGGETCTGSDLSVLKQGTSQEGGLKQTITVMVKGLSDCLAKKGSPVPKFVLYLDGNPLKGLQVTTPGQGHDDLRFFLDRVSDNKDSWAALLRNPTLEPRRVSLSVAMDDGPPVKSEVDAFSLVVINLHWLVIWAALFVFLLALFFWAAKASNIVREGGPPPPKRQNGTQPEKAFSLSRCQMAVWFFLIAMAFCLIFMITWDLGSISQGVLALMGISAGTGLAAAIVDTSKNGSAESQKRDLLVQKASLDADLQILQNAIKAAPAGVDTSVLNQQFLDKLKQSRAVQSKLLETEAQLATPASEGIVHDLLFDATGLSFHRFQMVAWTIILAMVFVVSVWGDLIMPEFNATLLGLMGISSGTYIGFKFPEQKNAVPASGATDEHG